MKTLQLVLVSILLPVCNLSETPIFAAKCAPSYSPERSP